MIPIHKLLQHFRAGIKVGASGSEIKSIIQGSVNLDPASIAAGVKGSITFNLAGAASGDALIMHPPTTLEAGLVFCGTNITAGVVTVYLFNPTGAGVDGASRAWQYTWIDLT